jgi:hypothetical protein
VSDVHDHDAVRTEKADVYAGSVRRAGLWLVGVTVGAMLILLPLMTLFEDLAESRDAEPRPLAFEGARQAPEPRLQRYPTRDVEVLRAEEEAILGSYGWVDRDAGLVRLRIERAMELVAERGLPPPEPAGAEAVAAAGSGGAGSR